MFLQQNIAYITQLIKPIKLIAKLMIGNDLGPTFNKTNNVKRYIFQHNGI